jgi:hypothetical protein
MAAQARALDAQIIVGLPTLGLAFASLVAGRLGQSRYVPLGYSRKFWYDDALSEPVTSISSPEAGKQLRLDPNLLPLIKGRRLALVDDAISTGATAVASVRLLRKVGVEIAGHDRRHEANQSLGGAGRSALRAACSPRGIRVPTIPARRRRLDTPHRDAAHRSLNLPVTTSDKLSDGGFLMPCLKAMRRCRRAAATCPHEPPRRSGSGQASMACLAVPSMFGPRDPRSGLRSCKPAAAIWGL